MKQEENIIVGISIGDLNGIGPEVALKTFEDPRMLEFCTPIIFASVKVVSFIKKQLGLTLNLNGINDLNKVVPGKINVYNAWNSGVNINFGKEDPVVGEFAIKSLFSATKALKSGQVDVLVTAPINKHNIQSKDFQFPGHTDYLAKELGGKSLMFMIHDDLRVGLLTDHVPVKEVANHITKKLIKEKVAMVIDSLKMDFQIAKPKVAVLGINPHTGDNGVIGKEDDEVLKPTLLEIREKGDLVYGPYSADSFFGSKNYQNFDAIIAAYHDQGLIPFKTLAFGKGVNFTAGLTKVRTSPDHGTAYEIAGKGEADETSFKEAVFKAISIFRNRNEYEKLTENPLKLKQKKL
ncbi:4-hydroxythreonine-4-phosphate dehydrogenase PdxA [Mangrovimonas sp. ST2L15]|uniref:4-hydroxythreonine-4-phosphate dehydrogenase PdxA n=1 Tax=Mangrovimonas sp. ST2L15 TaxID=1645916 RepID=UPI0006B646A2|nr:4-hydroxythreonine-4-phosphate dehydrogenase PdxA [Mangrovimonas sp. ST2L15]